MKGWQRIAWLVQVGILLAGPCLTAQVKVGDFTTTLTGTVAPGYSATYGNESSSSHSWALAGAGTLAGNYYNPNFVSYNSSFYLNQSRANSNFQSISNASGVNLTTSIFGGSHFPGSISYSNTWNSDGNYDVPGLANYVTHGNSDTFSASWSANLENLPSLSAGYQRGGSTYTVYGINDEGRNSFDSANVRSSYRVAGFNLGAFYSAGGSHSQIPSLVSDEGPSQIQATNDAMGANVSHALPMNGSASASFNRSYWDSNYLGSTTNGTIDLVNTIATVRPSQKLTFTASLNYSDNLTGQLLEAVVAAGGAVTGANTSQTSNSLDFLSVATYAITPRLQTSVSAEHRSQTFLGENYGDDTFAAGVTYLRNILDGTFNGSVSLTENSDEQGGGDTMGFTIAQNYSRKVEGWHVTESFGYAQNAETLLVTYMNSFYNYSLNVRRNWGTFNLSFGAGGSRTALTQNAGTTSSSENYSAAVGYGRWISVNGGYSKADGQALETGAGLVSVPIPSPVLPSSVISLYGGTSYSVGLSSSPVKNLILTAAYARSTTNITNAGITSGNDNDEFSTLIQYQTRKLSYNSGYARLGQGFGASGTPAATVSTYYVGVSRWFNVF
ncbi:MAG TPA: hypothetical protein VME68_07080 [Acidobacteriaceae bacterium]|nr:hypothetical protein [Acidobacteriaceae bacterium]